jgi:hypothetical protein
MNIEAALVLSILEKWRSYEWTLQGFGFIRTKIQNVGRIHVWDSKLTTPRVSTTHTHPWPLRSTIISGELINQRFTEIPAGGMPYLRSRIATGEGGGLIGEPEPVTLRTGDPEIHLAGETYEQEPTEIHRSIPQDGTVTLMVRPQGPPLEEAAVYWPNGTPWVTAEPRKAEEWEISDVIAYALARWAPRPESQKENLPNG